MSSIGTAFEDAVLSYLRGLADPCKPPIGSGTFLLLYANRTEVVRTFREALARDKTRTQVFDISELGLVEMTRKRISEGLVESFSETCPTCSGRGIVIDESLLL